MFQNPSTQSKSFLILAILVLVGALLSFTLSKKDFTISSVSEKETTGNLPSQSSESAQPNTSSGQPENSVSTAGWKEYENEELGLKFKYAPEWKILPAKKQGSFSVVEIDPGPKYFNLKIFVSNESYYALDGLNSQITQIGGQQALNISDMLYGVKVDGVHYTFDLDKSVILQPEFETLVSTVAFR